MKEVKFDSLNLSNIKIHLFQYRKKEQKSPKFFKIKQKENLIIITKKQFQEKKIKEFKINFMI